MSAKPISQAEIKGIVSTDILPSIRLMVGTINNYLKQHYILHSPDRIALDDKELPKLPNHSASEIAKYVQDMFNRAGWEAEWGYGGHRGGIYFAVTALPNPERSVSIQRWLSADEKDSITAYSPLQASKIDAQQREYVDKVIIELNSGIRQSVKSEVSSIPYLYTMEFQKLSPKLRQVVKQEYLDQSKILLSWDTGYSGFEVDYKLM